MGTQKTSPSSAADAQFRMIDVGEKAVTRRRALAQGRISMAPETFVRIKNKDMPKGDVLAMAEVAGIMAVKKTPDLLPLCHPLLVDATYVKCELEEKSSSVLVTCEVITHSKTGVEMEALMGVQTALLCIYDLTKIVDPVLTISDVFLRVKEGGKSGVWTRPGLSALKPEAQEKKEIKEKSLENIKAAILTISDRCSRKEAEDRSGPLLGDLLKELGAEVSLPLVVSDDVGEIRKAIQEMVASKAQIILTTGGTGLGPRDVTPEALTPLWTKKVPGLGEMLRMRGSFYTKMSWLSRSEGGLIGDTLVVLLPGSPKAVIEGFEGLQQLLSHALKMMKGEGH